MSTTNKWLIGIGVVLLLVLMYSLPFMLQGTNPFYSTGYGYGNMGGMMNGGSGMHGGMMNGGSGVRGGMHGGGMMGYGYGDSWLSIFTWLIPVSLLVLIGLGIAALVKYLRSVSAAG